MNTQKLKASTRGKAVRRAPIIRGMSQLPNGPTMTEVAIIIMMVPCSLTTAM